MWCLSEARRGTGVRVLGKAFRRTGVRSTVSFGTGGRRNVVEDMKMKILN